MKRPGVNALRNAFETDFKGLVDCFFSRLDCVFGVQPKALFPPQELSPGTRDFGPVLGVFPPREPGSK